MQRRLIWKVMALNFPVIALVIGVIWVSIEYLAADYFMELMNQYQIAPNDIHRMFLDSMHRYLAWASTIAVLLAALVSYVLSNRVLRPLNEVSHAIHRMSAGDRDARARTLSNDELGELAKAFNLMAQQVKEAENLRENMIVDLAHELRTPVTNIRGYVEGLRDGVIAPDNQNLSILEKESLRLGDLVESLLDLSRADAAKYNLQIRTLNIQDSVSIALDRNTEIIKQKKLNILVDVPKDAKSICADPEKLQLMLAVFIQNASQYSPPGSTISIWSERRNDELSLKMSNQAEAISCEDLALIFERFYRTEKSRSRNSGGAGIGLAIVKKLVDAHGGTVGASSEGDLFTIWFSIPDQYPAIEPKFQLS